MTNKEAEEMARTALGLLRQLDKQGVIENREGADYLKEAMGEYLKDAIESAQGLLWMFEDDDK
jgi:hypothetical protein